MDREFKRFDIDTWFARKLREHGVRILEGTTDPAIRRERIRAAIVGCHLAETPFGRNAAGQVENYAEVFERAYGSPLEAA